MTPLGFLVASAFFMEFLDGAIIVTALPSMAVSLGGDPIDLHIGITAYLLTVAIFILPGGWAADRYGPRRVFAAAIAVFTLGSALCGLAPTVPAFVAARIVQGLGGAMMVPVGRLAVLRVTEKAGLMRAIAVLTWPGLTAPILGPPLGGFITQHASWRWIFFINLPIGLVGFLLSLRLVPAARSATPRPFDLRGFLLGAALLAAGTTALDMLGDETHSWPLVAGLSAIALIAGTLLWHHSRTHPHPLLDPAPFRAQTYRLVMTAGTTMRLLVNAMPFLLPLLFQLGFGLDPFQAGLLVLALFAGNLGVKPLTTPILRRFGFRTTMLANGLLQAATMLACATLQPGTPTPVIFALLALSGASRSLQFTAFNTLAFADVPQPSMAPANTMFSVAFQLSLASASPLAALILHAATALSNERGLPGIPAFQAAFVALAALMVAATLFTLRLPRTAGATISGHA